MKNVVRLLSLTLALALFGNAAAVAEETDYTAAMAREHAGEEPTATEATAGAKGTATTEPVVYATVDGQEMKGVMARPTGEGSPTAAIVVIHEWWGLNDNVVAMARKLAGEGYLALAVDLYGGEVAADSQQARELMSSVEEEQAKENLRQAVARLSGESGIERVGVIGWCFGGGWSLRTALVAAEDIDAAVIYYGRLITEPEELSPLRAPVLGIFGAEDRGIPVASVEAFGEAMKKAGKELTVKIYEGAGHAFANPSGERYVAAAADDAWQRTTAFFDAHLRH